MTTGFDFHRGIFYQSSIVTVALKCTVLGSGGMGQTDRQTDGRIAAVLNVSPYLRGIVMQLLRTLRVCVLQRHYSDPAFKDRSVGREDTFLTVPLLREYHFNVPVSLSSHG